MDWNYYDTFITIAADCPAVTGTVPPDKKDGKTKAGIEFQLVYEHPYEYTQEDLLYEVHVRHKGIPQEELAAKGTQIRDEFFQKPMACLRASMLPKKFGWGIHFNKEGKMALVPMESDLYQQFIESGKGDVKLLPAMRNSRGK
ncbi:hypothetical protein FE783_19870 [Paenibacillus mesophilus]|uniref:DUF6157 family protein n=1 Tax=Paenibacillus mesophilus TaxID=2582849 RepID=UPI00110D684B|nr:DUF6157 family protein [Paenibacillus mesophilus]TMV48202.1 hypothetical protein FE783_19870 [Paenibacillus mesophilus]